MATEGDKQGKEAVKPASGAKPAAGRAKTAPRGGTKTGGRAAGSANRAGAKPAGRGSAKPAAKGSAKPAERARAATATAKTDRSSTDRSSKSGSKAVKTDEAAADGTGTGVNREMKRMMKKREGAADRLKKAPTAPSRKRTKPLTFLKEVRGELGRVAWPTQQEVITYSVVVLVTVIFFMVVIAGIDYVALKGVLFLIDRGGR